MLKYRRLGLSLLASLVITGGVAAVVLRPAPVIEKKGGRFARVDGPVPVRVALAKTADVPVYLETVGSARALSTVAVQPQVSGKLIEVAFKEGQTVEKGQLLARIDPSTFQSAVEQAEARRAQDESLLANAKLDLDRYLKITGAVPLKTVDTQRALVAQLTSQVASSSAALEQAQVQLAFTEIKAPATGRTGIRQVDEGNIVTGSGQTLVTITQIQPIAVIFNLPQQQLAKVNRAAAVGSVMVEATDTDNKQMVDRGKLLVVDNQVDQTTGTVKMKAEFPNATLQLWPGQFINVRVLIETLAEAITVPTAAVQRGPAGTFVYVVGTDDKVAVRGVVVPQQDDIRAVLASGVAAGERVVTSGFARLKEGAEVAAVTTEELDAAPVAPKREPTRGEGRRRREGGGPGEAAAQPPGEGRRNGEGRRKREETTPTSSAPQAQPTAPLSGVPTATDGMSTTADQSLPGKRAQGQPAAAAQ